MSESPSDFSRLLALHFHQNDASAQTSESLDATDAYLVEMSYSYWTFDSNPEDFLFFEMRRYPIILIPSADRNAQGRFSRSPNPLTVAFIPSAPRNIDVNIVDALREFLSIPTFQMIDGIGVFTHFISFLADIPEEVSLASFA
ncbi:hypothetical protein C8J57DRAFT_1522635 [Mycena rebaudengoi]|nr:hypothetical protein C8J57DRAFT_1522635 [Mycena rebaudengoi]